MKKIILILIISASIGSLQAQDFKTDLATAKTSYSTGKLEDAHFALQQMLQEIDIIIGQEVLKLLPQNLDTMKVNTKDDNVSGNIGFVGATIHRSFGSGDARRAEIEIVNNSPMIGTLNAFLTSPMLAGLGSDGKSKVIKIQGYKARLTKEDGAEEGKTNYRIEMPFSNALLTLRVDDTTDTKILAMANTLPIEQIAKLIQ